MFDNCGKYGRSVCRKCETMRNGKCDLISNIKSDFVVALLKTDCKIRWVAEKTSCSLIKKLDVR